MKGIRFLSTVIVIVIVTASVACNSATAEPPQRPQVVNHAAPGNLESNHDLGCIGGEQIENRYTPTDLYKSVAVCVRAGRYREADLLFAVAGVYGRFDTLRVSDKSAHQATQVALMQALAPLDEARKTAFRESLPKLFGDPQGLASSCREIERTGPPNYFPRYMIQHGMGAFLPAVPGNGLVENFDPKAAWKQSLDSYLHCPAS